MEKKNEKKTVCKKDEVKKDEAKTSLDEEQLDKVNGGCSECEDWNPDEGEEEAAGDDFY